MIFSAPLALTKLGPLAGPPANSRTEVSGGLLCLEVDQLRRRFFQIWDLDETVLLLWTSCREMLKPGGIWEFLGDPAVWLCQPVVPPSLYCFSGEELELLGSCQPSVRTLHVHSPCPPAVWSGNISWEQIKVTWSQTLCLRMSNTCMLHTVHSNLLAMQCVLHTQGAASSA